jgi:hypothetical protein
MKQAILLLLVIIMGGTTGAMAQGKFRFPGGDAQSLGKVKKGAVAQYTFEYENIGDKPLTVSQVIPGCSCMTVDWDKQPIAPHKKGKITVKVKTDEMSGPFDKSLCIRSDAALPNGEKQYIVFLKGVVE